MKTLPIIDLCHYDKSNTMLKEYLRQHREKIKGIVFVNVPVKQQETMEKILSERLEKENSEILKKIKQLNATMAKEIYKI